VASCDADFAPYLAGRPEAVAAMFGRFVSLARASGPVTFELQDGVVVLRGTRRIFASVRVTGSGLAGHVNLMRRVEDRRVRRTEAFTRSLVFHGFAVGSLSDLDDVFGGGWRRLGRWATARTCLVLVAGRARSRW
jgi:hypothetical protein